MGRIRVGYGPLTMIVLPRTDGYRCITQPDHAHLAGELMALWRAHGLPENPRRDDLLFAIREHDNGWRETDAAPHLDAERQRPHDFLSLPLPDRLRIWPRAVDRYADRRPYSALLIAHHARALYDEHRGEEEFADLFEALGSRRERLLEVLGGHADPPRRERLEELERHLEEDYPFLAFADLASLAVCNGWTEPFERELPYGTVRGRFDDETDTLFLEPFPLAGTTTFRVPCRHLPARPYTGDADLAVELATARWEELPVRVGPQSSAR